MFFRFRQALIGFLAGLCLVASLAGAAWLGIETALLTLPKEDTDAAAATTPKTGQILTLANTDEPLYLAESVQSLRDFYFTFPSADARQEGDAEARQLRRILEAVEARLIATDANAAEIEILSGAQKGIRGWVHLDQWQAAIETPDETPPSP